MRAIRFREFGGPEVLGVEDVPVPTPEAGQVRVDARAIGVNYMDVAMRGGARPLPLPSGIGLEAVGVVGAVGEGVTAFKPGDRVGYYLGPLGAYAEANCVNADHLVRIPSDMPDDAAVCLLTKAITAQFLLHRTAPIHAGQTVLVHAAAGGVGLFLTQWAKALGTQVVGVVGSEAKFAIAREHGCDHVVSRANADWPQQVRGLTGGVDVVFDPVGKDTFEGSIDCLNVRGAFISFGAITGPVPPIDLQAMSPRGSLNFRQTSGYHFSRNAAEIQEGFAGVAEAYRSGAIKAVVTRTLPLEAAAEAHHTLETRQTTGGLVLVP
jgi:NADPH2:quinone reductase